MSTHTFDIRIAALETKGGAIVYRSITRGVSGVVIECPHRNYHHTLNGDTQFCANGDVIYKTLDEAAATLKDNERFTFTEYTADAPTPANPTGGQSWQQD